MRDSWRFVSLAYQPKERFGALQAADIVAYEIYRDLPLVHSGSDEEPRYPLLRLLSTEHPTRVGFCSIETMKPRIDDLWKMLVDLTERGYRY